MSITDFLLSLHRLEHREKVNGQRAPQGNKSPAFEDRLHTRLSEGETLAASSTAFPLQVLRCHHSKPSQYAPGISADGLGVSISVFIPGVNKWTLSHAVTDLSAGSFAGSFVTHEWG